jgi:hypothetical protein
MAKRMFGLVVLLAAATIASRTVAWFPDPMPRALILVDYCCDENAHQVTSAAMEARNWSVSSMRWSEFATQAPNLNSDWDVVWILPGTSHELLWQVSKTGGPLEAFVQNGGIVIMPGLKSDSAAIDASPGGLDIMVQENPGPTGITQPQHPLIAAGTSGGVDLTVSDLDPAGTGGQASVSTPSEGPSCQCIAHNNIGTVLTEYTYGTGHVVISVLDLLNANCLTNLLLYAESLVNPAP